MLPPGLLPGFRANVGACVINRAGLVFAATRLDDPGRSWQMPQGGIDEGETPLDAAIREVRHTARMPGAGGTPPARLGTRLMGVCNSSAPALLVARA